MIDFTPATTGVSELAQFAFNSLPFVAIDLGEQRLSRLLREVRITEANLTHPLIPMLDILPLPIAVTSQLEGINASIRTP